MICLPLPLVTLWSRTCRYAVPPICNVDVINESIWLQDTSMHTLAVTVNNHSEQGMCLSLLGLCYWLELSLITE